MTHFLRFPDESTGMAALTYAGFTTTDEDGTTKVLTASHTHALDVIGAIYVGGEYDPETGETPDTPMPDDAWQRVQDTWAWSKGLSDILTERGWELVSEAVAEALDED